MTDWTINRAVPSAETAPIPVWDATERDASPSKAEVDNPVSQLCDPDRAVT